MVSEGCNGPLTRRKIREPTVCSRCSRWPLFDTTDDTRVAVITPDVVAGRRVGRYLDEEGDDEVGAGPAASPSGPIWAGLSRRRVVGALVDGPCREAALGSVDGVGSPYQEGGCLVGVVEDRHVVLDPPSGGCPEQVDAPARRAWSQRLSGCRR